MYSKFSAENKFSDLTLIVLQRFAAASWDAHEYDLCAFLSKLQCSISKDLQTIGLPQQGQAKFISRTKCLQKLQDWHHVTYENLQFINLYFNLSSHCVTASTLRAVVAEITLALRRISSSPKLDLQYPIDNFVLTRGFEYLTENGFHGMIDDSVLDCIMNASNSFGRHASYLRALSSLVASSSAERLRHCSKIETLTTNILMNLKSSSHLLRRLTLEILDGLSRSFGDTDANCLATALKIEETAFTVANVREISLHIRKLPALAQRCSPNQTALQAIPTYCFGLLQVRLTPIWEDTCTALQIMAQSKHLENCIMNLALDWLRTDSLSSKVSEKHQEQDPAQMSNASGMECTNLLFLKHEAHKVFAEDKSTEDQLHNIDDQNGPVKTPLFMPRLQALRVMNKAPSLAEKNSRILVPVFLDWFGYDFDHMQGEPEVSDEETLPSLPSPPPQSKAVASHEEKKGLLGVFARFVNPQVLYRESDVHSALLRVLQNGDVEIQRLALKALLTWKSPSLKPYEEKLLNLLDDKRFRDELTAFLNLERDESIIQQDHRAELMPVLLRLLYGRLTSRTGPKGKSGQEARRKATMAALARSGDHELGSFLHLAMEPLDKYRLLSSTHEGAVAEDQVTKHQGISLRKQLGILKMIATMLDELADSIRVFAFQIADTVLFCIITSCRSLERNHSISDPERTESNDVSLLKAVRHEGLKCLNLLLISCTDLNWKLYGSVIMKEIVQPRLHSLPIETAQSVSILLKLLSTFAQVPSLVGTFADSDGVIIRRVNECLVVPSAREEVKVYVLRNILKRFVEFSKPGKRLQGDMLQIRSAITTQLQRGLAYDILKNVSQLLEGTSNKDCLQAGLESLSDLAHYLTDDAQIEHLIRIAVYLLKQPAGRVGPLLKSRVMQFLTEIVPNWNISKGTGTFEDTIGSISSLFGYFKDGPNRSLVAELFRKLAEKDDDLKRVAVLCSQLNSFSSTTLNEPDYDARLKAFHEISDSGLDVFAAYQWRPLVHNLLFLIRDEELSMRANASLCLRRFIERVSSKNDANARAIVKDTLFPALCRGMREPSELVRAEYMEVLAELVRHESEQVKDLQALLGPDEEASFFSNIMHIQEHRRLRALRRLAAASLQISSTNVSRIFLPLLETILVDQNDTSANLISEALNTFGAVVQNLEWQKYRFLLQRMINEKNRFESKPGINPLAKTVDAYYQAHQIRARTSCGPSETDQTPSLAFSTLSKSLPSIETRTALVSESIVPKLLEYTHYKDESTVNFRISVAVSAVKLIMTFSQETIELRLPSVLMDICNILRSKAQEARDAARKTLTDIAVIVGPSYFGFILKQLRSSLQRGSQLHVLSYTLHSLLVSVSAKSKLGELDYCLPAMMAVIVEDIFGHVGQEKEADEYVSKMKEVKRKNLSYDSLEMLASFASVRQVSTLLEPIREQLKKPRPKIEKTDELLRRTREGLRRNSMIVDQTSLALCYQILRETLELNAAHTPLTSPSAYKMATFALDLLRRVLDKHENLKTANNLAGLMPKISRALHSSEEELQIAAMRLMTSLIRLPLKELDAYAGDLVKSVRRMIEAEPSTSTAMSQAALRLVSALLRERPSAIIKQSQFEIHTAFLLERIRPDLQDPARSGERERQVAAFNFLRAVLGRGVLVKEVYEVMDTVREVLVTSQDHPIPDLARSVYSRFLLDYFPEEGKGQAKQVDYLISNLQYPQPHGRQSVMDVLMFVLGKKSDETVQGMCVDFFLPLLLVMVTDTSEDCRKSARVLLQRILDRASDERLNLFKSQLRKWVDPKTDELWRRVGFQSWDVYFEVFGDAINEAKLILATTRMTIEDGDELLKTKRLPFSVDVLTLFKRLCSTFPSLVLSRVNTKVWAAIEDLAESEQASLQILSLNLIELLLADVARANAKSSHPIQFPLATSHQLEFNEERAANIKDVCINGLTRAGNEELISQATKNLALLGKIAISGNARDLLNQILSQLCSSIRLDTPDHSNGSKLTLMRLLHALCEICTKEVMRPSLHNVLRALHNLMDTTIPTSRSTNPSETETHDQLVTVARELLASLQTKHGTTDFVTEMQQVQREVRERREDRRAKRRIEAVSAPEQAAREKKLKHDASKAKRREKNAAAAGRRRGW